MKTINIKKILIGCLATIPLFASCCTGKKTPENTLSVFEIDGEAYYLQYVDREAHIRKTNLLKRIGEQANFNLSAIQMMKIY